jgi:hypothetical protein
VGLERFNIETIPFKIDNKIDHNNIVDARVIIDDYKIHYNRLTRSMGIRQDRQQQEPVSAGRDPPYLYG